MILPKLISIDTSIFGSLAKDYYSTNSFVSAKAKKAICHLIESGIMPFITFHHIQEILQHNDDNEVFKRWSLLKKFPYIAWICSYNDENVLGSVADAYLFEIDYLLKNQTPNTERFKSEVLNKYIKYSEGEEFIAKFENLYCQIRAYGLLDTQRVKEIESLSHVKSKEIENTKISVLLNSQLRKQNSSMSHMATFKRELVESLNQYGDTKLISPDTTANFFINEVAKTSQALYTVNSSLYEAFVKNAGVRMDQVSPDTTIGQLGNIAVYNEKNRQTLRRLGVPQEREVELSMSKQLVWSIEEHLDMAMKNEKRAHGSNMQDRHMGVFSIFVDIFTADKRVYEYFRQFSNKRPELSKCLGKIVKCSNYSNLIDLK